MTEWIHRQSQRLAATAAQELAALVAVSSPSGDVSGAEECVRVAASLLPEDAEVQRLPCSSPGHADDLLATVRGRGSRRLLLLGHLDTVVSHDDHHPLVPDADDPGVLRGSGSIDMKGGDVLALGVLRALAQDRTADLAEVALLLVCDEEWRRAPFAHGPRFAGYDACLCFEAGETTADGDDAVVVKRKAAGTIRVVAEGRSAHSGARPQDGRNALLALASVAQVVAAQGDPGGRDHLTSVPTVLRSGDAFNVVPAAGELLCDLRSDSEAAFDDVMSAIPRDVDGVGIEVETLRLWPGMDSREHAGGLLARASGALGRPIVASERGGASDASHIASVVPLTVDGLGPLGGGAHAPHEYVVRDSLQSRSAVALALADAVLGQ